MEDIASTSEALRGLPLADDFSVFQNRAEALLNGLYCYPLTVSPAALFRARKFKPGDRPTHVSELLHRAPDRVKAYGRCHEPGQSPLYLSDAVQTALNEVRAEPGDEVVVLKCNVPVEAGPLRLRAIGVITDDSLTTSLATIKECMLRDLGSPEDYEKVRAIEGAVSGLFREQVEDEREFKRTAAIASRSLAGPLHGILFPSVVTQWQTLNYALIPGIVLGTHLLPNSAARLKVKSIEWNMHHVECIETAWIRADGSLQWGAQITFEAPMPDYLVAPGMTDADARPVVAIPCSNGHSILELREHWQTVMRDRRRQELRLRRQGRKVRIREPCPLIGCGGITRPENAFEP